MTRNLLLALALLVAMTVSLRAEESAEKPIGTWTRTTTVDDHPVKVKIEVKADTIRCTVRTAEGLARETITIEADYFVTRDGLLLGVVPLGQGEKKAPEKESLKETLKERGFACRFKITKHGLVVSEVITGSDTDENTKKVLEGKYHKAEERPTTCRQRANPPAPPTAASYPGGWTPLPVPTCTAVPQASYSTSGTFPAVQACPAANTAVPASCPPPPSR
jgi:hypothetical protein